MVESIRQGFSKSETARRFGVNRSTVKRYVKRLDEGGSLAPKRRPGKRPKLDQAAMRLLEEDLAARPWATHRQRSEFLVAVSGVNVSEATICRAIKRLGHSRKKRSAGASERDEWLRLLWRSTVGTLDGRRLVFVDEMGAHTSFAPLYAYAPRGKRASFKVPRNKGKNTTLVASIGQEGMGPSMAVQGSMTREVFEAYVEHFLAPELRPGQVVVMDNLGAHTESGCRLCICQRD